MEKGYSHYSHAGTKDFLDYILAYQPEKAGVSFRVRTFRGRKAQVRITFVSPTAFRLRMVPDLADGTKGNPVFSFPGYEASRQAKAELGEKALLWGRGGYAGSQNYPANWAGDSSASKNNLHCLLTGGLNMGISGVPSGALT